MPVLRRVGRTFVIPVATTFILLSFLSFCLTNTVPAPAVLPGNAQTSVTPGNSRLEGDLSQQRANAVKEAFQHAWDGYSKYCFGEDEINTITSNCSNPRNQWGASAIDGLSTALVMQIQPIVSQVLDLIAKIDFSQTETQVSLFETTIRYLAGMLSAYDLLKGPLAGLVSDTTAVDQLLVQSKSLADALSFAFDTPTGIPHNDLFFTPNKSDNGLSTNGLATTGSLILEWTRLSDLLGDGKYAALTEKAQKFLLNPQPQTAEPFPGLLGTRITISNGRFEDSRGGWGGGDDSFYEYLIKMYVYDPARYSVYRDRWVLAADSSIKYLASHPSSRPELTFLATFNSRSLINSSQHLTCFDGGNFLLGGSVLGRQDYIDFGLALVNGCHNTYNSTATRIGPEAFSWKSSTAISGDGGFSEKAGFRITDAKYDLRPEVLESYYYAFRVTGDQKYRDWAWDAFLAINATCRTDIGFSAISNVNTAGGGVKKGKQESFMFAEVLKYAYLIHSEVRLSNRSFKMKNSSRNKNVLMISVVIQDAVWQVAQNGSNAFVFNTEAHPMKVYLDPEEKNRKVLQFIKAVTEQILVNVTLTE
ncbi:MAG: hypothetical protein LQ342_001116 [Letrouitia transgressa]|nr:MAG: hypothetical protein LQ342_001116 [Letrouitia transgressa]